MPITIVGDPLQSIYQFQGATPDLFSNIHRILPSMRSTSLKRNYRSVSQLVDMASAFRMEYKDILPEIEEMIPTRQPATGCLTVKEFPNSYQEFSYIVNYITDLHRNKNVEFKDIAILSRTNKILIDIESAFIKAHIPYHIRYDSHSILSQSPFKFIYSILSSAMNPSDIYSITEVFGNFKGIGKTAVSQYQTALQPFLSQNLPVRDSLDRLPVKNDKKLSQFRYMFEKLINPVSEFISSGQIAPKSLLTNIYSLLTRSFSFNDSYINGDVPCIAMDLEDFQKTHHALLNILEAQLQSSSFSQKNPSQQFQEFYESLQLSQEPEDDNASKVQLLTIHSAKGLEWRYVFYCNIHTFMPLDPSSIEDVSVFYVAVTRARDSLILTGSKLALDYANQLKPTRENPFLDIYLKGVSLIKAKYK